ncbi:kelch repeat-containing protein [Paraglaciecola aquimarina]|uniref:Kelch repeat-containing protein n=1 Tax=Paraglaciecola aquimarina TaxID=1235557 RepID=A0ABU3SYF2_9ALTE|nr:kelch repeat-containing protein [Paraglaciecola aquimarina]MDU0355045.1 kelch repeat-containing protein [Paraglaciecola aquimarina]
MMTKNKIVTVIICSVLFSCKVMADWQTLNPSGEATARHENGVVAHDNKVFVIGGRGIKAVEVYDPISNSWRKNNPTPIEFHHVTPVSFDGKILLVTGLTGRYPKEPPLSHVWEYDPRTDKWRTIFEIPKERRRGGAGVTVYQGKIYIVGGIKLGHTSGTSNMVDVYDPKAKSWTILTDAPHIRDHANAAILDGKLIAFGGRNSSYHEPEEFGAFMRQVNDKIDVYDIQSGIWKTLKIRLPIPTAGAGAVVYNNRLYYTGGEHAPTPANNRTVSFELTSKTWQEEGKLNRGRHGTNAVLIGNQMYIAMGSGNKGGGPELNSIEVLTLK